MWFRVILLVSLLYLVNCAAIEKPVDYSQHKIVKILPDKLEHFEDLLKIKSEYKIEFWNHLRKDLSPVTALLGPEKLSMLNALKSANIKYEINPKSFQQIIDEEREENDAVPELFSQDGASTYDYVSKYHTYDEIAAEIKAISTADTRTAAKSIGKSYESRDIPVLEIMNGTEKKIIMLECGIHAREWIAPAACMWMTNALLTDPANQVYLDKFNWIIVPTLNVDGYIYTWEHDRQWRKTRSKLHSGTCVGADPNRNWDDAWSKTGASNDSCSETYCGVSAFSEVESKHMADLITANKANIAAYFSFHSFSELFMYPYGYTHTLPPNSKDLDALAKAGVAAIKAAHGITFKYGNIADTIYVASGSSIDWAYDKAGVKTTFTLELRPASSASNGFVLPPAQIKAASEETWAGVKAVLDKLVV